MQSPIGGGGNGKRTARLPPRVTVAEVQEGPGPGAVRRPLSRGGLKGGFRRHVSR
jgi:hypothetical protein